LIKLLEDHLRKLRKEDGILSDDDRDDDDAAWVGWDAESTSSGESSDGWIDVHSDGDPELDISDSEDEHQRVRTRHNSESKSELITDVAIDEDGLISSRTSSLATTKA
jgi:hypothetical protein